MAIFENNWASIRRALTLTVQLVSDFGFNSQNLTAHNAILPIAYYLHKKKAGDVYLTRTIFTSDRTVIREWLIRRFGFQRGVRPLRRVQLGLPA